jgi:hypothetical protein
MILKKIYKFILVFVVLSLALPFSVSQGAMSGGAYSIYADTFSASDDPAASTGGTYTLRSSAGESAGI